MSWRIIHADCREAMALLDADNIDAIVCDPPCGLEFMGKEWDRLDGGLPQEAAWKGRRGKGGSSVGSDDTKPSSRHHVSIGGARSRFRRCTTCGKREFSGSPCSCDAPVWVYETPDGPPSGMVRQQRWHEAWSREALRILKPGAHLVAFGGTRTFHRLTCALEDAGFEIRDCLSYLYGSGFPKSLDVSKAIDKAAGAERERIRGVRSGVVGDTYAQDAWSREFKDSVLSADPITDAARQWQGWGTALKPAWEPIILARKPLSERNVAANVQKHGTGAINVDGCRIETSATDAEAMARCNTPGSGRFKATRSQPGAMGRSGSGEPMDTSAGRWPANLVLDEAAAGLLDDQADVHPAGHERPRTPGGAYDGSTGIGFAGGGTGIGAGEKGFRYGDTGGASRFFYTSKASTAERGEGNTHPTVKPVDLMRWLCRLVTPPGGTVLDCFAGSGSTGIAALREGFDFIGIEQSEEYVAIARRRIVDDAPLLNAAGATA